MRRLWLKIFFVLVIANIVFAFLLYWGFTWSFELAFKRYLKEQEETRFTPLIEALVTNYEEQGSWEWIFTDHGQWQALMREHIVRRESEQAPPPRNSEQGSAGGPGTNGGPGAGPGSNTGPRPSQTPPRGEAFDESLPPPYLRGPGGRPPRPTPTSTGFDPHLQVFNAEGLRVIGNPNHPGKIYRFPMELNGELIGELGVAADGSLLNAMTAVMANQNNNRLNYIATGLLAVSSVIAFVLATWLTRRIFRIKIGTGALVRGQFDHRIDVSGKDALANLAHDFNGLAESLEENRSAHRRWIASTSHELRTPVTILQGQIEALRDGIREVTPEYLVGLSEDIDRLNTLIDDLHQLSMSDLGALDYQKDNVDLIELIDDELEKIKPVIPEGLTLAWQPDFDSQYIVLGDARRLAQLVKNLMQNSIRYTDAPGEIRVLITATDKSVALTWEDSAPGVAKEECEQLTQPLYRTESSRSRAVGGSGLGLSIVQAIVKAHDGLLYAEPSRLGGLKWTVKFRRIVEK